MLFQLISIGNARIKLENQLRSVKKEKRWLVKTTADPDMSQNGTLAATGSRGFSRGGGSWQQSAATAATEQSSEEESDDDTFDGESSANEDVLNSGASSLRSPIFEKQEVFSKYRRHSFRVGYFDEEDEERSPGGGQGQQQSGGALLHHGATM